MDQLQKLIVESPAQKSSTDMPRCSDITLVLTRIKKMRDLKEEAEMNEKLKIIQEKERINALIDSVKRRLQEKDLAKITSSPKLGPITPFNANLKVSFSQLLSERRHVRQISTDSESAKGLKNTNSPRLAPIQKHTRHSSSIADFTTEIRKSVSGFSPTDCPSGDQSPQKKHYKRLSLSIKVSSPREQNEPSLRGFLTPNENTPSPSSFGDHLSLINSPIANYHKNLNTLSSPSSPTTKPILATRKRPSRFIVSQNYDKAENEPMIERNEPEGQVENDSVKSVNQIRKKLMFVEN